jgi:competence protein ComEA
MSELQAYINHILQDIVSKIPDTYLRYLSLLKAYVGWLGLAAIVAIAIFAYIWQGPATDPGRVQGLSIQAASLSATAASSPRDTSRQIYKIDVSGAVKQPGVKELQAGDRVEDAIKAAGGFTDQADANYIAISLNLAAKVQDGDKIFIPAQGQNADSATIGNSTSSITGSNKSVSSKSSTATVNGRVSINRSSAAQLDSLPGIGETYAQRIIAGRPYTSVNDLCSRSGIFRSAKTCDDIRNLVTL